MSNGKTVDIIIPLQDGGSEHGDLELRYFLRSLCENATGVGLVLVVTAERPAWMADGCTGISWLPETDIYRHNKDGNLFRKVLSGLLHANTEDVIFTADDCAILKPVNLATMPVTHATDGATAKLWNAKSAWTDRMRRTFGYVHGRTGKWLDVMYDSHLPTRLNRANAIEAIEECRDRWAVEFGGLNICTAIVPFAMPSDVKTTVAWGLLKSCFETGRKVESLGDRAFATWNDNGWNAGVAELLAKRFPNKCRYERQ